MKALRQRFASISSYTSYLYNSVHLSICPTTYTHLPISFAPLLMEKWAAYIFGHPETERLCT